MLYHQVVVNGKKVINEDVERYQNVKKGSKKQKNGSKKQSCKVPELFCIGRLQKKALKAPEEITWKQLFQNLSKSLKRLKKGLGNEVQNMTNKAGFDQEPF